MNERMGNIGKLTDYINQQPNPQQFLQMLWILTASQKENGKEGSAA